MLRVGGTVAGCAPGGRRSPSRVRVHWMTWSGGAEAAAGGVDTTRPSAVRLTGVGEGLRAGHGPARVDQREGVHSRARPRAVDAADAVARTEPEMAVEDGEPVAVESSSGRPRSPIALVVELAAVTGT